MKNTLKQSKCGLLDSIIVCYLITGTLLVENELRNNYSSAHKVLSWGIFIRGGLVTGISNANSTIHSKLNICWGPRSDYYLRPRMWSWEKYHVDSMQGTFLMGEESECHSYMVLIPLFTLNLTFVFDLYKAFRR